MEEFVFSIQMQIELLVRIILAALCGGMIGFERKNRLKEAGIRTHLIVSMASAVVMIISKYGFSDIDQFPEIRLDPSRVASQIITGVGFLGAGMIFVRKNAINGLTTAAGVWATSGIGMAVGSGLYFIGIAATALIVLFQILFHKNESFFRIPHTETIDLQIQNRPNAIKILQNELQSRKIEVLTLRVERVSDEIIAVDIFAKFPHAYHADDILSMFNDLPGIKSVDV